MNYSMVATVSAFTLTRHDAMLKPFAFPAESRAYALTGLSANVWHGGNTVRGITINAGILETLQGFSTQRNVLKGVTIAVGTGAQIMQLKVVDRNNEPVEGATCRVLNAISGSNNVLSFDGVDDYVSSAKMTPAGSYTVMFWININSLNALSEGDWFAGQRSQLSVNKDDWNIFRLTGYEGMQVLVWNTLGVIYTGKMRATTAPPINEWIHVAFHVDTLAGKLRTFWNGNQYEEVSFVGTPRSASDTLILARRGWMALGFVNAKYSDFRVYDAALTEAQIQAVMNERAGSGGNLKNYWKIDEGSGTALTDSVGAVNGTIYGATWQEADESFPLYYDGILRYDTTPYDIQTTNVNGLTTLNYQINRIHGLEVTLPGKRRFIMPFQRTTRGLLDWQVMLSDYLATFATDRGNILINSEPENNDSNFLIE